MIQGSALNEYEQRLAEAWAARTKPPGAPDEIVAAVLGIFEISIEDLQSENRNERIVDARSVIAHLLRRRGWTWLQIGNYLHRSPSACENLCKRVQRDYELRSLIQEVPA